MRPSRPSATAGPPWWERVGQPRQASRRGYVFFVAVSGSLAALQLLVLPRALDRAEFAVVVLAVSVTQGLLAIGDLGLGLFASDTTRRQGTRRELRALVLAVAVSLSTLVAGVFALVAAVDRDVEGVLWSSLCIGALTALVLWPRAVRSLASTAAGDEVGTLHNNLLWQNAPKLGMVLLAVTTRSPLAALLAGLLGSVLAGRLVSPTRIPLVVSTRPPLGKWSVALGFKVTSFGLIWADSYVIAAVAGLEQAGQYQVVARTLTAVTYLYLPLLALAEAAFNAGNRRRWLRTVLLAGAVTGAIDGLMVLLLLRLAPRIWPSYEISPQVAWLLAGASFVAFVSAAAGTLLLITGRRTSVLCANIAGLTVMVALATALVPRFGASGAATGSLFGYGVAAAVQLSVIFAVARRDPGLFRSTDLLVGRAT